MIFQPVTTLNSTVLDEIIISIRPEHAVALYSGIKLYELRRVVPKIVPRKAYLYETTGSKQISGHIVIERVIATSPDELWNIVGTKGTTRERFFKYFDNASIAYAFEVSHAVKYRNSVKVEELLSIETGFRAPQNFLYTQNLPKLKTFLWNISVAEAFATGDDEIALIPIAPEKYTVFTQMVIKHIDGAYRETGENYPKKLIEISKSGEDLEGVLTQRKSIYQIMYNDVIIGFVVLTDKNGGSVKTGPVVLFDDYIARGFGKKLRFKLHKSIGRAGYRKVYCTVPAGNINAIGYLMATGYHLEAHLERHYHEHHDEYVFGYPMSKYRATGREYIRQIEQITDKTLLCDLSIDIVSFIEEEFSAMYSAVDAEWALRQVNEAIAHGAGKGSEFRPRQIYLGRGQQLLALGLCLIKRGGSVKILLLTRTSHQRSLSDFISFIEASLKCTNNIRKLYAHVAVGDYDLLQSFYGCGFKAEGILERPHTDDTDLIAMGKLIVD